MTQAWATRFYAENDDGSSSLDEVAVSTEHGGFHMGYDEFRELFGLEIAKGKEIAFEVNAVHIRASTCDVPR